MSSLRNLRASKTNPCRICQGANQHCLNYEDGGTLCMRHAHPDAKEIQQKDGSIGYYYKPPGGGKVFQYQPPAPKAKPPKPLAPLVNRHRVYRDFLDMMRLSDEHRAHLLNVRKLPEAALMDFGTLWNDKDDPDWRAGVARDLAAVHDLQGVPGFFQKADGGWNIAGPRGILVPYMTPDREIQGFQVRPDDPSKGKYIWFSSNFDGGTASGYFTHYTHPINRIDVYICEGALKATTAAYLTDEAFIGLHGCFIGDVVELVRPLRNMPRFILCPDADWKTNEQVRRAWVKNVTALLNTRAEVQVMEWDDPKGIDDYLIQHGKMPRTRKGFEWVRQAAKAS